MYLLMAGAHRYAIDYSNKPGDRARRRASGSAAASIVDQLH
jgi:hypothetical protein